MARIAGVDLPRDKRVEIGLTYIYGIGRKTAGDIIAATGVNPDTRVRDLTEEDGVRHRKGLPVRGQRSKTNARTRKGPRKTMANKKK